MLAKRLSLIRHPVLPSSFQHEVPTFTSSSSLFQNRRCLLSSTNNNYSNVAFHTKPFSSSRDLPLSPNPSPKNKISTGGTLQLLLKGPYTNTISQQQQGNITRNFVRWKGSSCWNCSEEVEKEREGVVAVCEKCGVLQKGSGDYFSLLGMKRSTYRVDVSALSTYAKGLQRKLHPDLFAQRGKEVKEMSEELSSLVNKAYGTLAHPIERGRYLLRLKGVDDPEGDAEKTMTNDPMFLEEVMELNEELEELENEAEWREFRKRNREASKELQLKLERAFDKEDTKEAQILLGRLKYYDTLEGKLKELKTKLDIVE